MNNKHKKKIYSKIKYPIMRVKQIPENPMQFVSALYRKENIWSKFIDEVIYGEKKLKLSKEQNLKYVFSFIKQRQLRKDILKILMKTESYNPFRDPIPIDVLPQNYRNFISKIQKHILEQGTAVQKIQIKEINWKYREHTYKTAIINQSTENINKELYSQGYEIVILFNNQEYLIASNPSLKNKRPDFTLLYEKFNKYEQDCWYLHGHKGLLKVKNGGKSKIFTKQFLKELTK